MMSVDNVAKDVKNKRKRDVAEDLICPITLELPFDPVMAGDGRVYERKAIEEYFDSKVENEDWVRSPMTNEELEHLELLDATQHRNTIEVLIETGVITGELADKWNERVQAKEGLVKKAERGDHQSMFILIQNLRHGTGDFKQNIPEANAWAWSLHDAGGVLGTFELALMFLCGWGTRKNVQNGTMYLALCAKEYDCASYFLGRMLAKGECGLQKDRREAIKHLERALFGGCALKKMGNQQAAEASCLLAKLEKESW